MGNVQSGEVYRIYLSVRINTEENGELRYIPQVEIVNTLPTKIERTCSSSCSGTTIVL